MTKHYDIIIIGGGIVGLSLAALLTKHNFSVALIESQPPTLSWDENIPTARVSAIHNASQQLLCDLGVWNLLDKKTYSAMEKMHVWDHTQQAQLQFDCNDMHEMQIGWIIDNREIVKILWQKLESIDVYASKKPIQYEKNVLTLDDGQQLKSDLIVGADGAHSWVREQMPIHLQTRSYQQKAIIAVIETDYPHNHTAYQKFLITGPIALLPLSDAHHSALVWSADDEVSDELMQTTQNNFAKTLTDNMDYKLGKLKIVSERKQFPLTMRHATDYVSPNIALVGDAAHTIHPLAGLGVNLGLMDATCLTQTLIEARNRKKSLGDLRVLRRYSRARKAENTPIIAAMRGLKEIFAIDTPTFNFVRSFGVNTIDQSVLIKNCLISHAT